MACSNTGYTYSQASNKGCTDEYGCMAGICPDFVIRRHDTKPAFKVKIEDCDGPMDLTDLVLEASMWAKGKLKNALPEDQDYFGLADGIGFQQIMVGDIIIMDRGRLPEHMLVIAFDETNKLVRVQRAYHGTTAQSWKKGEPFRIMKFVGATAQTEMLYQDILQIDGTTAQNVLVDSFFIYEWGSQDTCLPGCYYLEFKLIKMSVESLEVSAQSITPSVVPSFTNPSLIPSNFSCGLPVGIDWIRRFPVEGEGFLIKITDSPTAEF